MSRKVPFLHKFLSRLDRVDRESLQSTVRSLALEHAQYHEILQSLPIGIALTARNGKILFINTQALDCLGADLRAADSPSKLSSLAQDAALRAFLEKLEKVDPKVLSEDLSVVLPKEMVLRVSVTPFDKSEAGERMILFTEGGQSKNQADDSLLQRRESLLKLAAGVAHEIGNPLNSIHIHLGLLKRDAEELPAPKQKNFLKTLSVLQAETSRLDRIIRAFLKATRKPPLRFKESDLNEVIQGSVDFFQPELEKHKIQIRFRPDRMLPCFLMDKERLREVFVNLIKNAMEAMPEGGLIRISVTHRAKAALIRVRDEGNGIPEDSLPHIFDAYYTTKPEGSGLGLVSVYNAVAEHGGRIEVETRQGKGTTFTLLLPVRQPRLQLPGYGSASGSAREKKNERNSEGA